jgi:hypothetical protein
MVHFRLCVAIPDADLVVVAAGKNSSSIADKNGSLGTALVAAEVAQLWISGYRAVAEESQRKWPKPFSVGLSPSHQQMLPIRSERGARAGRQSRF